MKHPNRYIKFKTKEEAFYNQYLAYRTLHLNYVITLLEHHCDKEEIDSALYSQFLEDRIKEKKYIISIQWMVLGVLDKIMKKIKVKK